MKVKLKTIMAGPLGTYHPGEHDLDEATAKALIESGQAEALPCAWNAAALASSAATVEQSPAPLEKAAFVGEAEPAKVEAPQQERWQKESKPQRRKQDG